MKQVKKADMYGVGQVVGDWPHGYEDGHDHKWCFPEDAEPSIYHEDVYCILCGAITYFPEYTIGDEGIIVPVVYEDEE